MSSMARLVSLAVLTVLIVFLGITFFQVIAPFLLPLFLAGVLAILCQPIFRYFIRKTKNRTRLAAGLTTVAVLAMFLVPLLVGTFIASVELITLAQSTLESNQWKQNVRTVREKFETDHLVESLLPYFPGSRDPDDFQVEVETSLQAALKDLSARTQGIAGAAAGAAPGMALGVLGSAVSGLISSLMFVIALYYFLADGPALLAATQSLIPVHANYQQELLTRFDKVVRAVVLSTILAATTQGLMTAGALVVFGFGHFFLVFIVATLAAMIPLAGTWLVWGPCAIWLAIQGHWDQAIYLTLFGSIVVGTMDNVVRTYILNTDAKLHPLLAFVSVLGGLQVMGLWGVFIGPTVASCLHALVQIFNTELKEFSKSRVLPDENPREEQVDQKAAPDEAPQELQPKETTRELASDSVETLNTDEKPGESTPTEAGKPKEPPATES